MTSDDARSALTHFLWTICILGSLITLSTCTVVSVQSCASVNANYEAYPIYRGNPCVRYIEKDKGE